MVLISLYKYFMLDPKHLLFCQRSDRVIAKLNGFRDAIVYWDPVENDIIYQQWFVLFICA